MSTWAERAAQQDNHRDELERLRLTKSILDRELKTIEGPNLFRRLFAEIEQQITEYNRLRGEEQMLAALIERPSSYASHPPDLVAKVQRRDGRKGPLTIEYSPVAHRLSYSCGNVKGELLVTVSAADQLQLETAYHVVKSLPEAAEDLLTEFHKSVF